MKVRSLRWIFVFFLFFNCLSFSSTAQVEWGPGTSLIYNFQTESFGTELRAHVILNERIVLAPEVSYFFPFNPIHELYAGMSVHYEFLFFNSFNPYVSLGAYYNRWINADQYAPGQRKANNFAPEAGIGIVRNNGCLRPFIENRYDWKWKEGNLRIGILWFFNSCRGGKGDDCPPVYL